MISKNALKNYCCEDISLIENYDNAIKDDTQIWCCHHRLETHNLDGSLRKDTLSPKQLNELGLYYNRPASEFIFLTRHEHMKLHMLISDRKELTSKTFKGKPKPESQRRKMAENEWFNNGVENVHAKECPEGYIPGRLNFTKEARNNMSKRCKRSHWYNNGEIEKFCEECPSGFKPGRIGDFSKIGSYGLHWFTNGEKQIMAKTCPIGFVPGQLKSKLKKQGESIKGLKFFNNGKVNVRSRSCPEGFVPGRLKDKVSLRWFTNGVIQTRAENCPIGFVPGRLPRK